MLGDDGAVILSPSDRSVLRVETTNPESGGNDTITGSNNDDLIFGGPGEERASRAVPMPGPTSSSAMTV